MPRMPYRFLVIMDPIERILPDKDTTFVLMLSALRRDHSVYYCQLTDLYSIGAKPHARCRRITVARATPHFAFYEERTEPLDWFNVILMRKDPPFDQSYLYSTHLLSLVDPARTIVANSPRGLRDANEKLYALNFPNVIPSTIVTADHSRLKGFLQDLGGEMIIKPLDGCGGAGVFHLRAGDRNLNALLEVSTDNGRRMIIGQQYIPAVRNGDKRIILLDGEPLGAILRVPAEEESRGNIHVGGTCIRTEITASDQRIVDALRPALKADGLFFTGIDVIGEYLTEVNVTSPTGIQEINALNGSSVEDLVIARLEERVSELA